MDRESLTAIYPWILVSMGTRAAAACKPGTHRDSHTPCNKHNGIGRFPGTFNNDNNLILRIVSRRTDWVHHRPYADGGGAMIDSQPSFGVVEFFVTPFDRLIWDNQEQSVVSPLYPGKTIGFTVHLVDVDENKQ